MKYVFIALLLIAGTAKADLDFTFVDGADIGLEPVLVAHKQEATAAGKSTWLWGSAGWTDPSGSYLYFSFHGYGDGYLFKRNSDGSYTDVTPAYDAGGITVPAEDRPLIFDVDNNGYMDIITVGDETPKAASLLNNGDGTWRLSMAHKAGGSEVVDVNGDGYLDILGFLGNYGKGMLSTRINLAGLGFDGSSTEIVLPPDAPQEVVDRLAGANDRFHGVKIYDLDASTYLVAYGGSYSGQKFTYAVRNGAVVDIGLPLDGTALTPVDMDGDGDLDIPIQWGTAAGFYKQSDDGTFAIDNGGDLWRINIGMKKGSYIWDIWPIDLDQDGDNDLVLSSKRTGIGYIMDNRNGVYKTIRTIYHVDGRAMNVGDLDGDGDIDVVIAGQGTNGDSVRNSDQAALYINNLNPVGGPTPTPTPTPVPTPTPTPAPTPTPTPEPTPQELIGVELEAAVTAIAEAEGQVAVSSWESAIAALTEAIGRLNAATEIAEGEQSPNFP